MRTVHKKLDLILFKVKAYMEDDHSHHYIGHFWLLLEPFISALIYYLVFKVLLHRGEDNYIQFLFIGIITWKWFSSSFQSGANSIYNNRALYKKIYLPKIIFPWIEVIYNTAKFLVVFAAVLVVYILILKSPVTINYLYLPGLILAEFVFSLGLATLFASFLPYFTDLKILIGFVLRLAFYPTGVIFSLNRIPEKYKFLVDYNPMAQAVHSFRDIIVYGKPPSHQGILLLLVVGIICYAIGSMMITSLDKEYAKIT